MHPQLLCGLAQVTRSRDQYLDDVAPPEFVNRILIGHTQRPHLLSDAARGQIHRAYVSNCSIEGQCQTTGRSLPGITQVFHRVSRPDREFGKMNLQQPELWKRSQDLPRCILLRLFRTMSAEVPGIYERRSSNSQ